MGVFSSNAAISHLRALLGTNRFRTIRWHVSDRRRVAVIANRLAAIIPDQVDFDESGHFMVPACPGTGGRSHSRERQGDVGFTNARDTVTSSGAPSVAVYRRIPALSSRRQGHQWILRPISVTVESLLAQPSGRSGLSWSPPCARQLSVPSVRPASDVVSGYLGAP